MEANQQMNEMTFPGASEPKESENDTGDRSNVSKSIVVHGDTDHEGSSNANVMRLVPIEIDSSHSHSHSHSHSPSAAAFSSIKMRPPPPFLLKVYDMVQDPETDSIISWNKDGTSFIVADQHRFAAEVLKRYFRHNNFSTFVCQLNTYCFKKISWDRLEFQNEWFRRGKKRWLKNIKRRHQNPYSFQQTAYPTVDLEESELRKEFEDTRNEHDALVAEIKELKAWHESAKEQIADLKQQVQCSSSKRKKMVSFMAQMVWMLKKGLNGSEVAKKPKLGGPGSETLMEIENAGETSNKSTLEIHRPNAQSDKQEVYLTADLGMLNVEDGNNTVYEVTIQDFSSQEFELLEKQLMEDISIGENLPREEIPKLQSGMVIEWEDLIEGPADWTEYTKEIIGKAKNLKSDPRLKWEKHSDHSSA